MKTHIKNAERLFETALKLLNRDCPKNGCEWCEKVWLNTVYLN